MSKMNSCNEKEVSNFGCDEKILKDRFALIHTRGNDSRFLMYVTDKEEGMMIGSRLYTVFKEDKGLISLIRADFNENDQVPSGRMSVYRSWIEEND